MTPREPDRFEAKAQETLDGLRDMWLTHPRAEKVALIAAALRAAEASALERVLKAKGRCYDDCVYAGKAREMLATLGLAPSPESPPAEVRWEGSLAVTSDTLRALRYAQPIPPSEPVAPAPSAAEKRIAELRELLRQSRYWLAARVVPVRAVSKPLIARIDAALASPGAAGEETHKP